MTGSTVLQDLNSLDIGLPSSISSSMGVRYFNSESYTLSANFTFCHEVAPPSLLLQNLTRYIIADIFDKCKCFLKKVYKLRKRIIT